MLQLFKNFATMSLKEFAFQQRFRLLTDSPLSEVDPGTLPLWHATCCRKPKVHGLSIAASYMQKFCSLK